jgi:hypothetical protein
VGEETKKSGREAKKEFHAFPLLKQAVVEIDDRIVTPQPLLELFTGYQFPRPLQQTEQHTERLRLQPEPNTGFAQLS